MTSKSDLKNLMWSYLMAFLTESECGTLSLVISLDG